MADFIMIAAIHLKNYEGDRIIKTTDFMWDILVHGQELSVDIQPGNPGFPSNVYQAV
jgi:hypothetical protein